MTNNLVKRLREVGNKNGLMYADYDTTIEAADELERLSAENARLREALENVLAWQDAVDVCAPELGGLLLAMYRARAALAENEKKQ